MLLSVCPFVFSILYDFRFLRILLGGVGRSLRNSRLDLCSGRIIINMQEVVISLLLACARAVRLFVCLCKNGERYGRKVAIDHYNRKSHKPF